MELARRIPQILNHVNDIDDKRRLEFVGGEIFVYDIDLVAITVNLLNVNYNSPLTTRKIPPLERRRLDVKPGRVPPRFHWISGGSDDGVGRAGEDAYEGANCFESIDRNHQRGASLVDKFNFNQGEIYESIKYGGGSSEA